MTSSSSLSLSKSSYSLLVLYYVLPYTIYSIIFSSLHTPDVLSKLQHVLSLASSWLSLTQSHLVHSPFHCILLVLLFPAISSSTTCPLSPILPYQTGITEILQEVIYIFSSLLTFFISRFSALPSLLCLGFRERSLFLFPFIAF